MRGRRTTWDEVFRFAVKWTVGTVLGAAFLFFVAPLFIDTAQLAWSWWTHFLGSK